MTFIAILIAVVIERFFDWSHIRAWHWFSALQKKITNKIPGQSPYVALAVTIVPFVLIVAAINLLLTGVLFGFPKLIFQLVILLGCLGSRNLWADAFDCMNALTQGDALHATDKLKASFDIAEVSNPQKLHHDLVRHIFIDSNHRVFAPVFWFVVLGPAGALLYRLTTISFLNTPKENVSPDFTEAAEKVESILDWLPARIFSFLFALSGHFVQVLTIWRKKAVLGMQANEALLADAGLAGIGLTEEATIAEDGTAEEEAISLLDRSFIIAMVLIAIIVLLT